MGKSRRTKKKSRTRAEQKKMEEFNEADRDEQHESALEDRHEEAEADPGLAQPEPEAAEAPPTDPLAIAQQERDALMDQLLRARAEFDNYRKRVARETESLRQRAAEALVHDLLTVIDNLDLALKYKDTDPAALAEGVAMVTRQMHDVLGRHGLTVIESEGKPFDPAVHEAVTQVPSDAVPRDQVVQEFQRGYMLGGRVLRPSKVTVSSGPADSAETSGTPDQHRA